jgi:hypothetical protein
MRDWRNGSSTRQVVRVVVLPGGRRSSLKSHTIIPSVELWNTRHTPNNMEIGQLHISYVQQALLRYTRPLDPSDHVSLLVSISFRLLARPLEIQ